MAVPQDYVCTCKLVGRSYVEDCLGRSQPGASCHGDAFNFLGGGVA